MVQIIGMEQDRGEEMKTKSGEIDPADYYRPIRVEGRTKWECIYCFKLLTRCSRGKHLKGKHAQEIG